MANDRIMDSNDGLRSIWIAPSFALAVIALLLCIPLALFLLTCRIRAHWKRQARRRHHHHHHQQQHQSTNSTCPTLIAFFHPHCSAGGGGERVLWKIIEVLWNHQQRERTTPQNQHLLQVLIYTVDAPSPEFRRDLLNHVKDRFCIDLTQQDTTTFLNFIHLHRYKHYLLPAKRLSLLVESFGTMQLAWKALTYSWDLVPDVFFDTTGCAFTFVVANLLMGCKVWAYVHYPTISTDMLQLVWQQRRAAYNHAEYIAQSKVATYAKLVYYSVFAILYGMTGSLAQVVLVNSTWTSNHIRSLWKLAAWKSRIQIVYPPCQVMDLQKKSATPLSLSNRQNVILSIGQFRPEKDHVLQIEALARLQEWHPEVKGKIKLVLLGSCRGESDQVRLEHLRSLAASYKFTPGKDIEFVVNQPYPILQEWLAKSSMGIHTMWNEHFGIGIVEMMAAGLVVLAHNSGGPKSDIVCDTDNDRGNQRTGFLASTADEYAESIHKILTMDSNQVYQIRMNAQESASRFSDEVFAKNMEGLFSSLLPSR